MLHCRVTYNPNYKLREVVLNYSTNFKNTIQVQYKYSYLIILPTFQYIHPDPHQNINLRRNSAFNSYLFINT